MFITVFLIDYWINYIYMMVPIMIQLIFKASMGGNTHPQHRNTNQTNQLIS